MLESLAHKGEMTIGPTLLRYWSNGLIGYWPDLFSSADGNNNSRALDTFGQPSPFNVQIEAAKRNCRKSLLWVWWRSSFQGLKCILQYFPNVPCITGIDHVRIKIKVEASEMFAEDLNVFAR